MKKAKYNDQNRLPENEYNPAMALCAADTFFCAAERCNENRHITNEKFEWLPVPAIVNMAFACELYMKSILILNTETSKEHNLNELYHTLPPKIKEKIQQKFNSDTPYFQESLNKVADCFEECRYLYEYETLTVNLPFLWRFAEVLKEISHNQVIGLLLQSSE